MDAASKPDEEEAMTVNDKSLDNLSENARALWDAALALARLRPGVSLPPLLVFTDPLRVPDPTGVALRLPAGSGLVFRHFGTPSAEETAWRLREITARRGIALMIGLDAELADRIGADGLHLPQRSRSTAPQVRKDHPQWLITAAAHVQGLADEADQTDQAIRETQGLDGLVLSPAFATRSPSPSRPPLGAAQIADFVSATKLPVYALGGINLTNVAQLSGTGICGIAGLEGFISLFCD
jgi:thiamine-phosphate pyrophosphorylase